MAEQRPKVVIVGGGFAGLEAAKKLVGSSAQITVIDKLNYHLFQPLLYQVATAGLSPADVATPIRAVFRAKSNVEVLMAEVVGVDLAEKVVKLAEAEPQHYDYLVLATGATTNYFGHSEWHKLSPGLKTIDDATDVRRNILMAFEKAEQAQSDDDREALMTFVIVGGGPTGVELAGSIAELARRTLARDFNHIKPASARIMLVEGMDHILATFPEDLQQKAMDSLTDLGVDIRLGEMVQSIDEDGVELPGGRIRCKTVIWAAGVVATPVASWLGLKPEKGGRVAVGKDLSLNGYPEVYIVGDAAWATDESGKPYPGVAPLAMQQGRYVGSRLRDIISGRRPKEAFKYFDKGNLATIGRTRAVAEVGKLHLSGFLAWVIWVFIHIAYLIGYRTKVVVLVQWAWAYVFWERGARLITHDRD